MENKVNYTVVGLFVIALTSALIILFFWLTTYEHAKVYKYYLVYMHEEVSGLSVQSSVRFNGVRVGYVKRIDLDMNNLQLVKLTLAIEESTPISTSTVATLMPQGITGVVYVGLKSESVRAPLLKAKKGQKYPVIPAKPSLLMQLGEAVPKLTKNLQEIGDRVNDVLSPKNRKAIHDTLENLSTFTKTLADNSKNLDASVKSLRKTLNNSAKASQDLPEAIKQLKLTLTATKTAAVSVSGASKALRGTLNDSRVALDNFANQVIPETQQMVSRLSGVAGNLVHVTRELNRNPSILVRGKQPEAPGPGEK